MIYTHIHIIYKYKNKNKYKYILGWHLFITINIMAYLNLKTKVYRNNFWHICSTHSSNCLVFDAIYTTIMLNCIKAFRYCYALFDMFAVILMYTKFCASICQSSQMWQGDVYATNTLKKFKYFVHKYTFLFSLLHVYLCVWL